MVYVDKAEDNSFSRVPLNDRPEKYKYNPQPIQFDWVLFLLIVNKTKHLQDITFP
jgi:hypothetical protein